MRQQGIRMLVLLCVVAQSACSSGQRDAVIGQPAPAAVSDLLAGWPDKPREVANAMIAKYGQPAEATATLLIWRGVGGWKQTVLSRDEVPHDFPKPHTDLLQQTINYRVPVDKYNELAAYDGSVIVERTKGEMSARCDKEEMNFLALNLAHDIITGKRTVEDARKFYAETATAFMNGQRPPYTQRLQFSVESAATGDRDKPFM